MRLIATDTLEITDFAPDQIPDYAILSHRWGAEEVTLQEMQQADATTKAKLGFKKVQQCCAKARADGFDYIWVDTCCIDKTSSAELSEAINSMYTWYYQAARCYAYLADVPSKCALQDSEWFARGWTLQELLAPEEVYFLDDQWAELGTKETLQQVVHERTGIPLDVLSGDVDVETASVAQRMSWAAKRNTTRLEDKAYSLLGIFGIQMPLLYGEGERAFTRLQHEIMKTSDDHSIFAWASADARGGLLATSPAAFEGSGRVQEKLNPGLASSSLTTSSRGVELEARIIAHGSGGLCLAVLNCTQPQQPENEAEGRHEPVGIWVRDKSRTLEMFERVTTEKMESVDLRKFLATQAPVRRICVESGRIKPLRRPPRARNAANTVPSSVPSSVPTNVPSNLPSSSVPNTVPNSPPKNVRNSLLSRVRNKVLNKASSSVPNSVPNSMPSVVANAATAPDGQLRNLRVYDEGTLSDLMNFSDPIALVRAAHEGDEDRVWLLLSRTDVSVNQVDGSKTSALSVAAERGHSSVVQLLLSRGAATNLPNIWGHTALHRAAYAGQVATVELLIEAYSDAMDATDKSGCTPLLVAVHQGQQAAAKALLAHGSDVHARDEEGRTTLVRAAVRGDEGMIQLLLDEAGAEAGALMEAPDKHGHTPLRAAAENGQTGAMALLLQKGAYAEARDPTGSTTLHWASLHGHGDVVKVLFQSGAGVDVMDDPQHTPLLYAAHQGHEDVVRALLDAGANIEARDKDGWTPLWNAAAYNHEGVVKMLVEAGADVHATSNSGATALDWAQQNHESHMAKLMLKYGASVNAAPNSVMGLVEWASKAGETSTFEKLSRLSPNEFDPGQYHTPIGWAADNGSAALVRKLLAEGADVNTADNNHTMLEDAARNGHLEVVQVLLDAGANVNQSGEDDGFWTGPTPLSCACSYGHEAVVKLLLERGADPDGMWIKRGKNEDRADDTPLRVAMHHRRHGIIKMLLDHGASISVGGRRPLLFHAIDNDDMATVKLLLKAGAHVDAKSGGETPLYFAAGRFKHEMARFLLEAGADIAARAHYGRTPLWEATYRNDAKMMRILLDAGADVEKGDDKGSPLQLAYDNDSPDIAKLLLERGAKTSFLKSVGAAGQGVRKSKELQALFKDVK